MTGPDEKPKRVLTVRGRRGLAALGAAAAVIGRDGITQDLKDGGPPVFVPKQLAEDLTGLKVPKVALRCRRGRNREKETKRRKLAKASRKRNR